MALTPVTENVIVLPDGQVPGGQAEMMMSGLVDGRFHTMSVRQQGAQIFSAERIDTEAELDGDFSELLGDYYNEELDATYWILERDGEHTLEISADRSG